MANPAGESNAEVLRLEFDTSSNHRRSRRLSNVADGRQKAEASIKPTADHPPPNWGILLRHNWGDSARH
jgi:hypothetical protein